MHEVIRLIILKMKMKMKKYVSLDKGIEIVNNVSQ